MRSRCVNVEMRNTGEEEMEGTKEERDGEEAKDEEEEQEEATHPIDKG